MAAAFAVVVLLASCGHPADSLWEARRQAKEGYAGQDDVETWRVHTKESLKRGSCAAVRLVVKREGRSPYEILAVLRFENGHWLPFNYFAIAAEHVAVADLEPAKPDCGVVSRTS
jgi:hypothetical protein